MRVILVFLATVGLVLFLASFLLDDRMPEFQGDGATVATSRVESETSLPRPVARVAANHPRFSSGEVRGDVGNQPIVAKTSEPVPEESVPQQKDGKSGRKLRWDQEEVVVGYSQVGELIVVDGDILIEPSQWRGRNKVALQKPRLWPHGAIPYDLGSWKTNPEIDRAIRSLNSYTNLQFVPHAGEPDYIRFEAGDGCFSHVGRIGGRQQVVVGARCGYGNIMHELLHVAGLFHEHMRFDRDQHVRIYWENVLPKFQANFSKVSEVMMDTSLPFDIHSIMMYGSHAFSVAPDKFSMLSIDNQWFRQNRSGLTEEDIMKVNALYP